MKQNINMNTFFFVYLSLKWRRLLRFLILTPVLYFIVVVSNCYYEWGLSSVYAYNCFLDFLPLLIPLGVSPLCSWLGKPFIVKAKS